MRSIHFYSTPSDIKRVLHRFEANAPLQYAQSGKRSELARPVYMTYRDIPDIGIATHGTGLSSPSYVVAMRGKKYILSTFHDNEGEQRWLLMNGDNDNSVSLTVAGIWKTGTLLPGVISTLHTTKTAQKLMRWFMNALQEERFFEIGPYWLGIEALEMARSGKRLTSAEQSPPKFDFHLPDSMG